MIVKMDLRFFVHANKISPPVSILSNFSSLINTITNTVELWGDEQHVFAKRYILSL